MQFMQDVVLLFDSYQKVGVFFLSRISPFRWIFILRFTEIGINIPSPQIFNEKLNSEKESIPVQNEGVQNFSLVT